jgi:hyperosmotically inducible protein
MKKVILSGICSTLLVFVSGCASNSRYQSSHYVDDSALRAKVKTALWQDRMVNPFDIGADVARGNVHLTGAVDTLEQKRRADQIASTIPGVVLVRNDLAIRPVTTFGAPARAELGVITEDPAILLGRVIATPDVYYGKNVELQGTVDTVLSPNSFTMYSAGLRENPILVVARDRDLRNIMPNDVVKVRGELEPFNRATVAQRFNMELEPRKFDAWTDRASVLADTVRKP